MHKLQTELGVSEARFFANFGTQYIVTGAFVPWTFCTRQNCKHYCLL